MRVDDWRSVLQVFQNDHGYREPLLVWVRPSLSLVNFIAEEMRKVGLNKISSVGCGCGTLEWIIQEASDLEVTGYEVNRIWWESNHSTPHFIHLEYVEEKGVNLKLPTDSAVMFCYFNNLEFFHQYLTNYSGPCVILIGPVDGKRHCDPEPGYLESFPTQWTVQSRMVISGGDEIVIY